MCCFQPTNKQLRLLVNLQNIPEKTQGSSVCVCGWKEVEKGGVVFSARANRNVLHICECIPAQDETEYGSGVTDWRREKEPCLM